MTAPLDFLEFLNAPASVSTNELLDRVLAHSRMLTGAEAGTIFLLRRRDRRRWLEATHLQNDRVEGPPATLKVKVTRTSIAGYVAATGRVLRIPDAYRIAASRPYRFDPSADRALGYQTRSVLAFPLKNGSGQVIGVVELINRRDKRGRGPLPFAAADAKLLAPLNHFIGGAIERADLLDRVSTQNVELARRGRRIAGLQRATETAFQLSVKLLARAAELHDEDTGNHILRVNEYSYWLARAIRQPAEWCNELRYSAALHDVGKMSIDAAVLKKKGKLDPAEREEMSRHPEYGWRILSDNPRLGMAAEIAYCHHERWDGSGYPRGLAGDAIPLSARIVQIADVYDALRSPRPYKPGFTHEMAVRILLEGDERIVPSRDFDPRLLRVFARHHKAFDRIWRRLQD
jgi:HD-GYP domain-containing protein (c-di-GMP phosphodiesterase class II)